MTRILVVEDSRTQRHLMAGLLTDQGFQVQTAPDGAKALEQVSTFAPDVVVLDVLIPELNGYEVCRRLKSKPETRKIRVLFCSSQSSESDRYWALKQGGDAYLVKPFSPTAFLATVNDLLQKIA
jgi:twitching motility two-component system response regulator PilH